MYTYSMCYYVDQSLKYRMLLILVEYFLYNFQKKSLINISEINT